MIIHLHVVVIRQIIPIISKIYFMICDNIDFALLGKPNNTFSVGGAERASVFQNQKYHSVRQTDIIIISIISIITIIIIITAIIV